MEPEIWMKRNTFGWHARWSDDADGSEECCGSTPEAAVRRLMETRAPIDDWKRALFHQRELIFKLRDRVEALENMDGWAETLSDTDLAKWINLAADGLAPEHARRAVVREVARRRKMVDLKDAV